MHSGKIDKPWEVCIKPLVLRTGKAAPWVMGVRVRQVRPRRRRVALGAFSHKYYSSPCLSGKAPGPTAGGLGPALAGP